MLEMQRGSISPIRIKSPLELTWRDSEPSAKLTSMRHVRADAFESRHKKVGGMMSGGKMEPIRDSQWLSMSSRISTDSNPHSQGNGQALQQARTKELFQEKEY